LFIVLKRMNFSSLDFGMVMVEWLEDVMMIDEDDNDGGVIK